MAKISANGCHEIARFRVARKREAGFIKTVLLRSDGAILQKLNLKGATWTVWYKAHTIHKPDLNADALRHWLEEYGHYEVLDA